MRATVENITHKGEQRIKVVFAYDETIKENIKKIKDARWSQSKRCWHIPYSKAAYAALQQVFDDIIVVKNGKDFLPISEIKPTITKPSDNPTHFIKVAAENDQRMKVFVPHWRKNEIAKIRTITGRSWNTKQKYWSVPMTKEVVEQLNTWFVGEIVWTFEVEKNLVVTNVFKPSLPNKEIVAPFRKVEVGTPVPIHKTKEVIENQLLTIPIVELSSTITVQLGIQPTFRTIQYKEFSNLVVVGEKVILSKENDSFINAFIPGDKKGWVEFIRTLEGRKWNKDKKCWRLPMVQATFMALEKFFVEDVIANFNLPKQLPEYWHHPNAKLRKSTKKTCNIFQERALTALEEKLMLEHKRYTTIKTYKNCLKGLLFYYPDIKPSQITKEQIVQYLLYNIKEKKVSKSTQGQIINALNAFYIRVLNQVEKVQEIERPKKQKKLPNVLSEEEVQRLLKASDNLKHKCMLILIYSAGLRKGELLNLQVNDLNAQRKTLFVKNGKGGKDRYTFYSDTAIKYLEKYLKAYQPKGWLFQGQTGGRYSETSLQKVFQKAKTQSAVNPQITIHGLRHSFATHLVEKGVPLHVVQQLLGHHSIKTTEIYLHISNQYMKELKSPLENLDI